ncbi:MAG: hypothetical protein J7K40_10075 [candidate division Zixibacteria bacterium]|nr:hypothetical protein [candidate division Zixibacteria bacterium]
MLLWCIALFVLGVFALLDSIFIHAEVYHVITSTLIIFISLWFFIKFRKLGSFKFIQETKRQSAEPENRMTQTSEPPAQKKKEPEKVYQ